jgi:hypothetical protein
MKELGHDLDMIADMLGQEGAGMAAWYARERKSWPALSHEHLSNKSV